MDRRQKVVRGRRIVVSIAKSSGADDVLNAACRKFAAHDKNFDADISWTLRYADGTKVETLPEGSERFQLHMYKEQVMKDYQRIILFICPGETFSGCFSLFLQSVSHSCMRIE